LAIRNSDIIKVERKTMILTPELEAIIDELLEGDFISNLNKDER